MSSVLSWTIGSLVFLVLFTGFTGIMGQEIAGADVGSTPNLNSDAVSVNSSGSLRASEAVTFFQGFRVAWGEAPAIISTLLIIPSIIVAIGAYLIIVRGTN